MQCLDLGGMLFSIISQDCKMITNAQGWVIHIPYDICISILIESYINLIGKSHLWDKIQSLLLFNPVHAIFFAWIRYFIEGILSQRWNFTMPH